MFVVLPTEPWKCGDVIPLVRDVVREAAMFLLWNLYKETVVSAQRLLRYLQLPDRNSRGTFVIF